MNIELLYHNSAFAFDASPLKSLNYIREIASKIFALQKESIEIYYNDTLIPINTTFLKDYFTSMDHISLTIEGKETMNICPINTEMKNSMHNWCTPMKKNTFLNSINPGVKESKYNGNRDFKSSNGNDKCNKCNKNESEYYCRNCSSFFCWKCLNKFHNETNESNAHAKIQIDNSNWMQGALRYQRNFIDNINKAQKQLGEICGNTPINMKEIIEMQVEKIKELIKDFEEKAEELWSIYPERENHFDLSDQGFDMFKQRIFSATENNEDSDKIFQNWALKESDLLIMKKEIKTVATKNEFKQVVFSVVEGMQVTLTTLINDIDKICIMNKATNCANIIKDIEEFISKTKVKYPIIKDITTWCKTKYNIEEYKSRNINNEDTSNYSNAVALTTPTGEIKPEIWGKAINSILKSKGKPTNRNSQNLKLKSNFKLSGNNVGSRRSSNQFIQRNSLTNIKGGRKISALKRISIINKNPISLTKKMRTTNSSDKSNFNNGIFSRKADSVSSNNTTKNMTKSFDPKKRPERKNSILNEGIIWINNLSNPLLQNTKKKKKKDKKMRLI